MSQPPADQDRDPQQGGQPRNEGNQDQQFGQYPPGYGPPGQQNPQGGYPRPEPIPSRATPSRVTRSRAIRQPEQGQGSSPGTSSTARVAGISRAAATSSPAIRQQYPPGPPGWGQQGYPPQQPPQGYPPQQPPQGWDPNQQNYQNYGQQYPQQQYGAAAGGRRHAVGRRRIRPHLPAAARLERHRPRPGRGLPAAGHLGLPPARRHLLRRPVRRAARPRLDQRHHRQRLVGADLAARGRRRHPHRPLDGRVLQQVLTADHHVPALILQLTRVGFLILLCLFVLAAMRVIRTDLRMAGVTARRGAAGPAARRPGARAGRRRAGMAPSLLVVTAGTMAGTRLRLGPGPILIGRAEDSHPGAGRRLRLDPARPDHPAGSGVLPGGPRVHQRHLPRPGAGDHADPGAGRRSDPDRPHRHRAASMTPRNVDSPGPRQQPRQLGTSADPSHAGRGAGMTHQLRFRRAHRPRPDPLQQPGLGLRRATPCSSSPTAWADTRPATWRPGWSCSRSLPLDTASRRATCLRAAAPRRPATATRRSRRSCTTTPSSTAWAPRSPPCCSTAAGSALAHVGDSRAYLYRDGVLHQLTHDDTFVQSLIDDGRITQEEAAHHPQRSLLLRALNGTDVDPSLTIREVSVGDRYLICSDGLPGVVSAEAIADALAEPGRRRGGRRPDPARPGRRRPGQHHGHRRRRRRHRRRNRPDRRRTADADPDATGPIGSVNSIRVTQEMPRVPLPAHPRGHARDNPCSRTRTERRRRRGRARGAHRSDPRQRSARRTAVAAAS